MSDLYRLGCGMTAPEFSANHSHEMECYEPVEVDWAAAAKEVGSIVRGYVMWQDHQHKHVGVDEGLEGQWAGRVVGAALSELK